MKNILFIFIGVISLHLSANAQRDCGTTEYMQEQLLMHPEWQNVLDSIETFTQDYLRNPPINDRANITIPVVVHVVWNSPNQNISDAQIMSQIAVLNKDFRKLNSDWGQVPFQWLPLVADCEINFCLATRNPSGNPTTGIERRQTSISSFCLNNAVKFTSKGGLDAWTSSKYLNLWICDLQSLNLGYAQFPGGPTATDGVVIDFTCFGTNGTVIPPYDKGRTATHEIGHWLNLYHIWGGNEITCADDDRCNDTPIQERPTTTCPTGVQLSCSNGPYGNMYMNYMDYTPDACMYMFTSGQKARMQALFASGGVRSPLLSSDGCSTPNTCAAPVGLSTTGITQLYASLSWSPVYGATNYTVQYRVKDGYWTERATTSSTSTSVGYNGAVPNATLAAGVEYQWRVRANCNNYGQTSPWSAIQNFTTLPSSCAGPAKNQLTAYNIGSYTAIVSCSKTSTAYKYRIKPAGQNGWSSFEVNFHSENYNAYSNLSPCTTYEFQCSIKCSSSGSSGWSTSQFFTTNCSVSCDIPITYGTSSITQTTAILTWLPSTNAASYAVQYKSPNGLWTDVPGGPWLETQVKVTTLLPNTQYQWRVRTNCPNVNSDWTQPVSFTTLTNNDLTCPLTDAFQVSPSMKTVGATAGSTTFTVNASTNWTTSDDASWFYVSPYSGSSNGTITVTYTANTGAEARDGKVFIMSGGAVKNVILIQLAPVPPILNVSPDAKSVGPSAGSETFSITSNVPWTISDNATWLSVSPVSGMNNGTVTYTYTGNTTTNSRTATITISGGGLTKTVTVTQAGSAGCPTPTDQATTNITSTTAKFNWAAVAGAQNYSLQTKSVNGTWVDVTGGPWTSTSVSMGGFAPNTSYEWRVRSNCSNGQNSNWSTGTSFTTNNNSIPANDNCVNAITLSVNSNCLYTSSTNVNASASMPAPTGTCPAVGYKDDWFEFTIPNVSNPQVTIRTTAGTLTDGVMEVYYGSPGTTCSNMVYLACEDDNTDGNGSYMPVINLQDGANYTIWVRVWGYNGSTGTFSICVLDYNSANVTGNKNTDEYRIASVIPKVLFEKPEQESAALLNNINGDGLRQVKHARPNPANDILNVIFTQTSDCKVVSMTLFDLSSRIMFNHVNKELDIDTLDQTFNVSGLKSGIYTLQIITTKGAVTEKVIITRD